MSRARWTGFAVGAGIVALATLPPFVGPGFRNILMEAFSGVCHQIADRSTHVAGIPFAVCHRCYGIYVGIPLAAISFPWLGRAVPALRSRAPLALAASLVPIGIDWSLEASGLAPGNPVIRTVTGLFFGVVSGYFLVRALGDLSKPAPGAAPDEPGTDTGPPGPPP